MLCADECYQIQLLLIICVRDLPVWTRIWVYIPSLKKFQLEGCIAVQTVGNPSPQKVFSDERLLNKRMTCWLFTAKSRLKRAGMQASSNNQSQMNEAHCVHCAQVLVQVFNPDSQHIKTMCYAEQCTSKHSFLHSQPSNTPRKTSVPSNFQE